MARSPIGAIALPILPLPSCQRAVRSMVHALEEKQRGTAGDRRAAPITLRAATGQAKPGNECPNEMICASITPRSVP